MQIVASYFCYPSAGDRWKPSRSRVYDLQERSQADTFGGKLLKTEGPLVLERSKRPNRQSRTFLFQETGHSAMARDLQ